MYKAPTFRIQFILKILFALVFVVTALVYFVNQINNTKYVQENFTKVEAEITAVYQSGRGIRQRTIIQVRFVYNDANGSGTVYRNGYAEGQYHTGDRLTIYINPEDQNDLR
jgi:hypothetical protein